MKPTLLILAAVLLAGTVSAEDGFPHGGVMGIYFSATEFGPEYTNHDSDGAPFSIYFALTGAQVTTVAGYECRFWADDPTVFLLSIDVDSDQSSIEIDNQIIAFNTPKIVPESGELLLSSVLALYTGVQTISLSMGPSIPSSGTADNNPWGWTWNGPLIAVDETPEGLHRCDLSSGASGTPDVVATLNRPGTPVTPHSWTGIKRLFH